jgi:hypothetical protein
MNRKTDTSTNEYICLGRLSRSPHRRCGSPANRSFRIPKSLQVGNFIQPPLWGQTK